MVHRILYLDFSVLLFISLFGQQLLWPSCQCLSITSVTYSRPISSSERQNCRTYLAWIRDRTAPISEVFGVMFSIVFQFQFQFQFQMYLESCERFDLPCWVAIADFLRRNIQQFIIAKFDDMYQTELNGSLWSVRNMSFWCYLADHVFFVFFWHLK